MTLNQGTSYLPESKYRRFVAVRPVVTVVFIILTLAVYIAQVVTEAQFGVDYPLQFGAKYGPIIYFSDEYWRLVTPIFLHGGLVHFFVNMYSLFILGMVIEKFWGHRDFFLFYLITGFAGNAFSYIFNFNSVSVGASTSIYGLLAAYLFFILKNRQFMPNFWKQLRSVLFTIGVNFLISLRGNIDLWGHIGGFVSGVLICVFAAPTLKDRVQLMDMNFYASNGSELSDESETPVIDNALYETVSPARRFLTFALVTLIFVLLVVYFDRYDHLIAPLTYR